MTKTILILAITVAFLAGSLVTGSIAFGEDGLTKLQKKCAKEPKNPQKIKPDCELLALINAIPAGPQGEQGPKGEQGEQGEPSTSTSVIRFDAGNYQEVNMNPLFFINGNTEGTPNNIGFLDFRRGSTLVGLDGEITQLRYDIGPATLNGLTITVSVWKNNVVIGSCSVITGPSSTNCVASLNVPVSAGDLVAVSDVSPSNTVSVSFRHAAVVVTS